MYDYVLNTLNEKNKIKHTKNIIISMHNFDFHFFLFEKKFKF